MIEITIGYVWHIFFYLQLDIYVYLRKRHVHIFQDVSTVADLMKTRMSDSNRDTYRGFPFKGIGEFSTGMAKWVNEDDRMLMMFGIPPYPSPYPAYPLVRLCLPGTGHISILDSAANARVLIIYLRDVRRTCRTFAIARDRTLSIAAFWISRLFRAWPLFAPRCGMGLTFFGDTVVAANHDVY